MCVYGYYFHCLSIAVINLLVTLWYAFLDNLQYAFLTAVINGFFFYFKRLLLRKTIYFCRDFGKIFKEALVNQLLSPLRKILISVAETETFLTQIWLHLFKIISHSEEAKDLNDFF